MMSVGRYPSENTRRKRARRREGGRRERRDKADATIYANARRIRVFVEILSPVSLMKNLLLLRTYVRTYARTNAVRSTPSLLYVCLLLAVSLAVLLVYSILVGG